MQVPLCAPACMTSGSLLCELPLIRGIFVLNKECTLTRGSGDSDDNPRARGENEGAGGQQMCRPHAAAYASSNVRILVV